VKIIKHLNQNMHLRWKATLPIIAAIAFGVVATIIVTGIATKQVVLEEVKNSTLPGYRDIVLNSLVTMMTEKNYRDSRNQYLKQMKQLVDFRIIRADVLNQKYGNGNSDNYPKDDLEKEVVTKGMERVAVEGKDIRGVYPYIARSNLLGSNCLTCHQVREGDVLGAISIKVPLKGSFGRIRTLQLIYAGLGIMGILSAAGMVFLIFMVIVNKPLNDVAQKIECIASGDLRVNIEYNNKKDVISKLVRNMNKMVHSFSNMIDNMLSSCNNVIFALDVLRSRSEKSAESAKNQSRQIDHIATAAEEMSHTITDIAKNASVASDTSSAAMNIAEGGKKVADGAVETVNRVYTSTVGLATIVEKLNNRVAEIGDIVTVIKDIADQTNLLALNAAIEAARAGEQGRGFAVVADEVRKLAEKTIKATAEISEKISAVQNESLQTTKSMDGASNEVTMATENIKQVGDFLNQIVGAVQKVRDQIISIATAVDEQSAASEDAAKNIEKTSIITKEIEKMSDDVMCEVFGMIRIAEELRNSTIGLRTKGKESMAFDLAKTEHKVLIGKVATCLKGKTKLDPSQLPDQHTCRFGHWYDNEGQQKYGHLPSLRAIIATHERFHSLAKEAVSAYNTGGNGNAEKIYSEMEDLLKQVDGLFDRIQRDIQGVAST